MNEEIMRILKMVEEGKLTAEKATELIDALNGAEKKVSVKNYEDKFFRLKVLSHDGDKVNMQLPVKVIREILKVTGKIPMKMDGMDGINMDDLMNTIVSCLDNEVMGEIMNVESADGDIVKMYID